MVGRGRSAGWEQLGVVQAGVDGLLEVAERDLEEVGGLVVLQGLVVDLWAAGLWVRGLGHQLGFVFVSVPVVF